MAGLDDEFRRKFPHLAEELGGREGLRVDAVRSTEEESEKAARSVEGFEPTAVDFLRRCKTDGQAVEIIDYLEEKGKITEEYAKKLRRQLVRSGVRSFGKQRGAGSYERGEII